MRILTPIITIMLILAPSVGLCLSDKEVFELLSQKSKEIKQFPFHISIEFGYGDFEGVPLPISSYDFFQPVYRELEYRQPDQIFATYHFSQGNRWTCFLLRVPNMYDSNAISVWIFDKERNAWQEPMKIAEYWGDAGYSINVQAWIEDVSKDGGLDIIQRTIETNIDPENPNTTTKRKDAVFLWDKDHFRDASREYLPKIKLNKYSLNEFGEN